MGDHRISLTIRAKFHGKVYEIKDAWWNWCGPVDPRVIEFFEEMTEDGMRRYHEKMWEADREERARKAEERDRAESERLKAKYGDQGDGISMTFGR